MEGLVTIIIFVVITVIAANFIYSMAKYIEKSNEMNETAQILIEEYEEKC